VSLILRLVFIGVPPLVADCEPTHCAGWDLGLIFDEWYYVNAARNIIGRPMVFGYMGELAVITNNSMTTVATRYYAVTDVYANATKFTDPNTEHPPLAKLVVAFSALLLGENSVAYRLPSVIFGTLLLLFLYLAVKKLASDQIAFYAATFLSFETLTFVHSRIFMLDIFMVSLMVLGFCLFLRGHHFAAGAATALSALSKEIGAIGLAVIISFLVLERIARGEPKIKRTVESVGKVVVGFALPVALLLGFIAIWWNVSPSQQIQDIFALTGVKVDHYNLDGSYVDIGSSYAQFGNVCPPWLWIFNRNAIEYLSRVIDGSLVVKYVGVMNPLLVYIMLPAVAYSIWHYRNTRDRADLFGVVWWAWSYLVYYPLAFAGRAMYLFYMLPVMGAISLMAANLKCHPKMNPYVRYLYTGTVIVLMLLQFPVRPP
jgi:predicted membrane-bound dolichyl-phosphate-mannose-protein mannosyltransferase